MNEWNGLAARWVDWLAATSLQASVLVILVVVAQWGLRKFLPARWRYLLWLLVVVRLLLPVLPESPAVVAHYLPPTPPPTFQLFAPDPFSATGGIDFPPPASADLRRWSLDGKLLAFAIWGSGVLALAALLLIRNVHFHRLVRREGHATEMRVRELARTAALELGWKGAVPIVETGAVRTPAVVGLFAPRLLLPEGIALRLSDEDLLMVFRHEMAHLKRRDLAVDFLCSLLQIVHWFNPVLWWAFRRMRDDRELATDALALSHRGEAREAYGATLLKLVASQPDRAPLSPSIGILEGKRQLRQRIERIASLKPNAYGWSLLGIVLLAVLGAVCLTRAKAKEPVLVEVASYLVEVKDDPQYPGRALRVESLLRKGGLKALSQDNDIYGVSLPKVTVQEGNWAEVNLPFGEVPGSKAMGGITIRALPRVRGDRITVRGRMTRSYFLDLEPDPVTSEQVPHFGAVDMDFTYKQASGKFMVFPEKGALIAYTKPNQTFLFLVVEAKIVKNNVSAGAPVATVAPVPNSAVDQPSPKGQTRRLQVTYVQTPFEQGAAGSSTMTQVDASFLLRTPSNKMERLIDSPLKAGANTFQFKTPSGLDGIVTFDLGDSATPKMQDIAVKITTSNWEMSWPKVSLRPGECFVVTGGNEKISKATNIVIEFVDAPAAPETGTYQAGIPHEKWDGWDDMVPPHLSPQGKPAAAPEQFEIVKRSGKTPRTFSGKVVMDGPMDGVEVGLVSLVGIHWTHPDQYQWEPVHPDGTFAIEDASHPDAWKALALRGPHTAWTFLRYNFNPQEGARNIVLKAAPSKKINLTASGADGVNLTGVDYEPFNARPQYDDRGDNLCRQRYDYLESGDADHFDAVLPVGEVALFVHRAGYAQDYQIVDTSRADRIHFILRKAGRMKITVLGADGKPMGNVRVKWINPAAPLSLVERRVEGSTFADWLVPGTFQLDVDGFAHREVQVREGETTEVVYRVGETP